jgi:hypothetical protein
MHLVEILLPLFDNDGTPFADRAFNRVATELTRRFGGVTAFTRAPAQGRWKGDGGETRDEIVVFEVMVEAIDRPWWQGYRRTLEGRFHQDEIVIRAHPIERL